MRIGFVRHGLTDWNALGKIQGQTDIPLNDEGRRQARMLGERLRQEEYDWNYVITSGLMRAEETGSIIASILDVPMLEPDVRLRERRYGMVEGLTAAERESRFGKEWHTQELGQEKDQELQLRGLQFLEEIVCKHPDSNLIVVSHGGFLAQLYRGIFQNRYTERLGNLSLTIVEKAEAEWSPLLYNCTRHLMENRR